MLDSLALTLCDMQGKLFQLSGREGYDSEAFIRAFMRSAAAEELDQPFGYMQWSGEAYILSRLKDECGADLTRGETVYDSETLYWTGYLYRYWHYYTGENSREILKQAPAKTMQVVYLMYHTMSPELAIDRLKETCRDKKSK